MCCDDITMKSAQSRNPGGNIIDRDAVLKTIFCIIFSIMALGFFSSWIQRCLHDPNEDVSSFERVIYSYASCSRYQENEGWAVPVFAYCMFYSWNIIWSVLCLVFLIGVSQCWVRLSCSMLAVGTIVIAFMDIISLANTWNNQEDMYLTYPKNYRTHHLWQNMFLQLIYFFAQLFMYSTSIWDAWFRNSADTSITGRRSDRLVKLS